MFHRRTFSSSRPSPHDPSPSPNTLSHTAGSTQLSTAHSLDLPLVGCENDILIPTVAQINTTFITGHSLWSAYLRIAGALLPGTMPACCLQPLKMLGAIPPLPENIRVKQEIKGHAIWNVLAQSCARGTWRMIAKMNPLQGDFPNVPPRSSL
jgi:hypothetical protein